MLRTTFGLTLMVAVTGCAAPEQKEPPLVGTVSIASGPCLGLCPVFTMEVNTEDRYRLASGANTINEGNSTGGLPFGSLRRALGLLDRYDFNNKQRSYVPGNSVTCPEQVSGTPTLTIIRQAGDFRKVVTYDVGCLGFAEKDSLDQLIEGLYRTFRISDLVAVGEPPKAEDQQQ